MRARNQEKRGEAQLRAKETHDHRVKQFNPLIGRTIVGVRVATTSERDLNGWSRRPFILLLDNNTEIYAADDYSAGTLVHSIKGDDGSPYLRSFEPMQYFGTIPGVDDQNNPTNILLKEDF